MTKKNDPTIQTVIDQEHKDDMGRIGQRTREVKLYYYKGKGIQMSIRTFVKQGAWETTNLFGDGNTLLTIDPGTYRPKALREHGERLVANADQIHEMMTDWHDDEKWTREQRAATAWQIARIVTGEADSAEAA